MLNGVLRAGTVIYTALLLKQFVNETLAGHSGSIVLVTQLIIVSLLILSLRILERRLSEGVSQSYINRVRSSLLNRLFRASVRTVQGQPVGARAARLGGDLNSLKRWVSLGLVRLMVNGVMLMVVMSAIATQSISVAINLSGTMLILLGLSWVLGGPLRNSIKATRSSKIRLQSLLVERLAQLSSIRACGQESREKKRIQRLGRKLEKQMIYQGSLLGSLKGLSEATAIILMIVGLISIQFSHQLWSGGEVAALIGLIGFVVSPVRELARVHEYYRGAEVSLAKIEQQFSLPRIVVSRRRLRDELPVKGSLKFENVTLTPMIHGFSGEVKPGQKVSLVGHNGSGKSTLLQLASGLQSPQKGRVLMQGVRAVRLTALARSRHIGMAGPELGLIRGSLRKNLAYRHPDASDAELYELLKELHLSALLKKLPKGLDSSLSEFAANLSSGEKSRIILARAVLRQPDVLLLDEPEANLDHKGREVLTRLIKQYPGSILMVTHCPSLSDLCDLQWDLDQYKQHNNTVSKTARTPLTLVNKTKINE